MNKKLENICRVCLNIGSRNIFEKSSTTNDSQFSIPAIGENVSSLDRLVEKLRYVTMLKVDECENLPKNMCDSCIIQLNVAYNLKKNAIQSDMKLRQYMIEFGMNVTSFTACSINTVSMIRPPPAILMPTSTTSESVTITTAKSTTVGPVRVPVAVPVSVQPSAQPQTPHMQKQTQVQQQQQQQQQKQKQVQLQPPPPLPPSQVQRPFPVMPIIIKEEPVDYECEVMSDITVDTNGAEAFEHRNGHHVNGIRSTISTTSSSNKSMTPLPIHSMVSINPVNSKSLLISTQTASDSEYISAYILTNTDKTTKTNTTTKSVAKRKSPTKSISLAEPKSKQKPKQNSNPNPKPSTPSSSSSPSVTPPRQQANKQKNRSNNTSDGSSSQHSPATKNRSREIDRLNDDSLIQNKSLNESAGRQTRQKLKTVEPNTNGLQQSNQQQQQQPQPQQQRSRSRNSTPKIDYKSFFSVRELKRRLSMDHSVGARRKIAVGKPMPNKIKSPTVNGKRGNTTPQSRARI